MIEACESTNPSYARRVSECASKCKTPNDFVRVAMATIAPNGTPQASGWSVSTTTGVVTFTTAPALGVAISAGFEFDVPVRFDTDVFDVTLDLERLGSITSIPLLEIRA